MDLVNQLTTVLSEPTTIVGMGNCLRCDDAVGLHLIDALAAERPLKKQLKLLKVEDVLENYLFTLADGEAKNVLLLDAVVGQQTPPGSIVFGTLTELPDMTQTVSTHKASLQMADHIFKSGGKTGYLLGVVADDIDYGEGMGPAVSQSFKQLRNILADLASEKE